MKIKYFPKNVQFGLENSKNTCWRTSYGTEVDVIAYGPKGLYAFEIKSKTYVDKKDLSGLHAFRKDYPQAKLYLIYNGGHKEYHNDVQFIPMIDALKTLPEILGFCAE